jgi:nicotinamide riboside transporter PnuC
MLRKYNFVIFTLIFGILFGMVFFTGYYRTDAKTDMVKTNTEQSFCTSPSDL